MSRGGYDHRSEWLADLAGRDDEALTTMLAMRPDLAAAAPDDLASLARLSTMAESVRCFFEAADRTTRQVLEALCVLDELTDTAALANALGCGVHDLVTVLLRLDTAGLVLVRDGWLLRNPGLIGGIPRPARLGPSAAAALAWQPVRALVEMSQRLGVHSEGSKAEMLATLLEALRCPRRMAEIVSAGPAGTEVIAQRMARHGLEIRLGYDSYHTSSQSDRTPEGWLLRRGLLVSESWGTATMPCEVALALRDGRLFDDFSADGPPLTCLSAAGNAVDEQATQVALAIVADISLVVESFGVDPPKLLQSGGLGVRELRRAAKGIGRNEVETARLIELARVSGLVGADERAGVASPTVIYDDWLEAPAARRWTLVAASWLMSPLHLSLAGAIDHKDKMIPALLWRTAESNAAARRRLVMGLLTTIPPGRSSSPGALVARAQWQAPALWQGGPASPATLAGWVIEEAELIGLCVGGAPSSFGRAIIDGDVERAAAGLGALSPRVTDEIVLQGDLTAVVSGELACALRREMDLLADVESSGAATVYRFSESSLRRGFDAGHTSGGIVDLLARHAPKGIPQPLAYLIDDLGRRYGRLRVGAAACYLRCDDTALLAEIVRARKVERLGLWLLASTVALSSVDPPTVVAVLRDAGYLAAPESPEGLLVRVRPAARRMSPPDGFAGGGGIGHLEVENRLDHDDVAVLVKRMRQG